MPYDPIDWDNRYFVTAETAIKAAFEFIQTNTRPSCVQWEQL